MPTIREIAETCGVSKPTVTAKLKELDMWDGHVSKVGKTFQVSAEATSAVAAALAPSVKKAEPEPQAPEKSVLDVYAEYIEGLKDINEKLWERLKEKDEQIADLQRQLAESGKRTSFWSRLLPGSKD